WVAQASLPARSSEVTSVPQLLNARQFSIAATDSRLNAAIVEPLPFSSFRASHVVAIVLPQNENPSRLGRPPAPSNEPSMTVGWVFQNDAERLTWLRRWQVLSQRSLLRPLPSSHSSPASMMPLPQRPSATSSAARPPLDVTGWPCASTTWSGARVSAPVSGFIA